jgi:hypothetical protein
VEATAGKRAGVKLDKIAPQRKWRIEFNRKTLADGSQEIYWNYRTGSGNDRKYQRGGKANALPEAHKERMQKWLKNKPNQ